jgi:drug/metabolite transporter (DMT)-like permease
LDWRILAISVPLLFVSYQALSKLLPKGTSIFLVNAYASLVGVLLMLALHFAASPNKSLQLPGKVLLLALGMGALISLGNTGIIKAYALGAPQSQFTPLFYITLIIYGIVLGFIIWHEKLQAIQALGIVMACVGLFLVVAFKK